MTTHQPLDGLIHQRLVKGMIDAHCCPSPGELSKGLEVPLSDIKSSLQRLESNHGLVLHPHECSVWMIHPFAVSPSNTWIHKDHGGWWAPSHDPDCPMFAEIAAQNPPWMNSGKAD